MNESNFDQATHRRGFLGFVAKGAAAVGISAAFTSLPLKQIQKTAGISNMDVSAMNEADVWFGRVKGKHRVVFDATRPNEIMPFVWPRIFLVTNAATGTPEHDNSVVVVLRHDAIPYAFQDAMWEKYHFADVFKAGDVGGAFQASDAKTATKTRNPFWNTKHGDFMAPGIGAVDIGIKDLMASGVMFCVCNAAMTVFSNVVGGMNNMKADDVMADWKAHIIPGVQIVPSGVWALGRAQEHKCSYIFAG